MLSLLNNYSIRDWIIDNVPEVEGYGNYKQTFKNKIPDHAVFKESLRNEHEGDIGVFVINSGDDWTMKYCKVSQAEIQIVVNAVHGDVEGAERLLQNLFDNLHNNKGNDKIKITSCHKINLRAGGKNTNGIHWSVLNILIKYILM